MELNASRHQKLRRDDDRAGKTTDEVEMSYPRLSVNAGNVPEIPGHEKIYVVNRGKSNMEGVGKETPLKNTAADIACRKHGGFFPQRQLWERANKVEVCRAVRFGKMFQLIAD
jgi:hypothetical protein